jgi:hypothetical protein
LRVRGLRSCVPTHTTHRSGLSVVKRLVPRSLGHGCRPIVHGRSVSFEETPGTDEARVLVIEAVGSSGPSVRANGRVSQRTARQAAEGRPSSKQAAIAADAGSCGLPRNQVGCYGRGRRSAQAPSRLRTRHRLTPVRVANRCESTRPNRHRGGTVRSSVWRRKASESSWLKRFDDVRMRAESLIGRQAL